MRVITLIPSQVGVGTMELGSRRVGLLRCVGSGQYADIGLDIALDLPMLGQLTAELDQLRLQLVSAGDG